MNDAMELQIRPALRADLEWIHHEEDGCWIVRDPLTNNFFQFNDLERSVAQNLNGKQSREEILQFIARTFPSLHDVSGWFSLFLSKLKYGQLLLPTLDSRATPEARAKDDVGLFKQIFWSPLSIRVPLFRPQNATGLSRTLAFSLFHPVTALLTLVFSLAMMVFVISKMQSGAVDTSQDFQLIQGDRWLALLLLYCIVKSLHEYGHYLGCVRWKAQVKEVGLLFLFFTPCLYCDITDSWRVPNRWHRAAIAAAGIYVEVIIACVASLVWLSAEGGFPRVLAASVIGLCSLGTIVVNGNPFFRYDGYYILSDLWGVPNLAQQASSALWAYFIFFMGGRAPRQQDFTADVRLLATFALAASIYRNFVLFCLLWLVWSVLVPIGLGFLAFSIFATTCIGMAMMFRRFVGHFMIEFHSVKPVRITRVLALCSALFVAIYAVLTIQFPSTVHARASLDFEDCIPVYATDASKLLYAADVEVPVKEGQLVLQFESPEKQKELMQLRHEIYDLKARRDLLQKNSIDEPSAAYEIPTVEALIQELESRKRIMERELESLNFHAPFDGWLIPASTKVEPPLAPPMDTRTLGRPLSTNNLGCFVERGELLGWFTRKSSIVMRALISEDDVKRIQRDAACRFRLDSDLTMSHPCRIERISPDPIELIPEVMIGDPYLILVRDPRGQIKPEVPHYLVTLSSDISFPSAIKGSLAMVSLDVDSKTIYERLLDALLKEMRLPNRY